MNNLIVRNGELLIAVLAAFIALVGAVAHVSEPIERAATHVRR